MDTNEEEQVITTTEYENSLKELKKVVEEVAGQESGLSEEKGQQLRQQIAVCAMKTRRLRRELMLGLERKRYTVRKNAEKVFQEQTSVTLFTELTKAGRLCSELTTSEIQETRESANNALSVPLEQFLETNSLPEGETETENEQLVRRIEHEIQICEKKGEELQAITTEKLSHTGELKVCKRFFQSSVAPLSDLVTKIERTNTSLGGDPAAVVGFTPSYLPISLFRLYQYFEEYLPTGSVLLEGSISDARSFIKAGKHTQHKCSLTELFPVRVAVTLPSGDCSLRLYYLPAKQGIIAEAIRFNQCVLSNLSPGSECISGLLYQGGTLVTGVSTKWLEAIANTPSYSPSVMHMVDSLCREVTYRVHLQQMLQVLRSRTCLAAANLANLTNLYMPSFPVPKVTVSDVKLENITKEKEDKKVRRDDASRKDEHLPKSVSIRLDMDNITYKITGIVSVGYPTVAPQFKIRIRKDEDKQTKTVIPSCLKDLSTPVANLNEAAPPVPGVQFVVSKQKNKRGSSKKRTRAVAEDDYTGFTKELTEYYSRLINRDVVRDTPVSAKGFLLIRQILMSLFCVERFHPLLLVQGVARTWTSLPSNPDDALTTIHSPTDFKLHHHAKLFRGREVHLPMYWGTDQSLHWAYRPEQGVNEDGEKNEVK
eukprot:TRINITY_DN6158_c0_g1_i1.p1 TRINITY_DN6158_c0_g1~~TRINITY_DN6158_c0_g1_i1.p1  ORF type:complete len:674 (+),score=107.07 TRINITY_DN6158_c0_g1_i1:61-2022(+)